MRYVLQIYDGRDGLEDLLDDAGYVGETDRASARGALRALIQEVDSGAHDAVVDAAIARLRHAASSSRAERVATVSISNESIMVECAVCTEDSVAFLVVIRIRN